MALSSKEKKEFFKNILEKYKKELLADKFGPIVDDVAGDNLDKRQAFIDAMDELGIEYLKHTDHIPARFFYNTDIKKIDIPENIKEIGDSAFEGCEHLDDVTLPTSYTGELPKSCFRGCTALQNIFLPDNVTGCGTYCFKDCDNLKTIIIRGLKKDERGPNDPKRVFNGKAPDKDQLKSLLTLIHPSETDYKKFYK